LAAWEEEEEVKRRTYLGFKRMKHRLMASIYRYRLFDVV
jgi:hypothetical protein